MKALDPTWWCKVNGSSGVYEQQNGYGRIVRLKERAKVAGWSLYIAGEYRGNWRTFAQTKRRALEITS